MKGYVRISEGAKRAATRLTEAVNGYVSEKETAFALLSQHRTLQQNLMRVFVEYVKAQAENEYADARNEDTVKLCKQLMNIPEVRDLFNKGLPYV